MRWCPDFEFRGTQGLDRNKVEDALIKVFQAADAGSTGILSMSQISAAIQTANLNLSEKQVQALATAGVEGEGSGINTVEYNKVIDVAWDLLILVRAPHNIHYNPTRWLHYNPTRWPQSYRIVMRCAPCTSNGPNHLGLLCALQVARETFVSEKLATL